MNVSKQFVGKKLFSSSILKSITHHKSAKKRYKKEKMEKHDLSNFFINTITRNCQERKKIRRNLVEPSALPQNIK